MPRPRTSPRPPAAPASADPAQQPAHTHHPATAPPPHAPPPAPRSNAPPPHPGPHPTTPAAETAPPPPRTTPPAHTPSDPAAPHHHPAPPPRPARPDAHPAPRTPHQTPPRTPETPPATPPPSPPAAPPAPCTPTPPSPHPPLRPATRPPRPAPHPTARCPSTARVAASDHPTSASPSASPPALVNSASRLACPRSPAADLADTTHGTTGALPGTRPSPAAAALSPAALALSPATAPWAGSSWAGSSWAGACSRMTWALVPLIPNEDTPARRGSPVSGHGVASVTSSTDPADQSTCDDGASMCNVGGTTPCRIAATILITPATPAAAWAWPMFDFTDPTSNGPRPAARSCPYVAISACASIGSPSVVPVPCASTTSTWPALSPALASADRITRCWDGPLGAVSPLLAPS